MSLVRLSPVILFSIGLLFTPGCGGDSAVSDQPDGFFVATSRTMAEGKPQHAWRAMPESYRGDIDALVQEFAGKMDADVWDKGFGVARKFNQVLDKQRDLILANPFMAMLPVKPDDIKEQLDGIVGALGALLASEISTLDGLKGLDLDDFMSGTMSKVFAPIREMAESSGQDLAAGWMEANFKSSVVTEDGDTATIKLELEGKEAEEHKVVKVDGVWVPEEMARDWKSKIAEAREGLASMVIDPASKMEIMTGIGAMDAMLDQLLAAKDATEFGQALGQAMEMFGKLGG